MAGLRRAETAGRRCLKLPLGELRHRLVNVPSVLRTAAHCDAGFPSALLRLLATAYVFIISNFRKPRPVKMFEVD